jgi:transaldolase
MEFYLDTANLDAIDTALDLYPIAGVTTNPTILSKEGITDVFAHLKTIQKRLGPDRGLHVQTLSDTAEGIIAEAAILRQRLGSTVYVKIPTTPEGLKAMKHLHSHGVRITATAITSKLQAYLAINAGADYLAPYVNRMENLDIDAMEVLSSIAAFIVNTNSPTKIIAASFKNLAQINGAIDAGVHAVTIDPSFYTLACSSAHLQKTVEDFKADFEKAFGKGKTFLDL